MGAAFVWHSVYNYWVVNPQNKLLSTCDSWLWLLAYQIYPVTPSWVQTFRLETTVLISVISHFWPLTPSEIHYSIDELHNIIFPQMNNYNYSPFFSWYNNFTDWTCFLSKWHRRVGAESSCLCVAHIFCLSGVMITESGICASMEGTAGQTHTKGWPLALCTQTSQSTWERWPAGRKANI